MHSPMSKFAMRRAYTKPGGYILYISRASICFTNATSPLYYLVISEIGVHARYDMLLDQQPVGRCRLWPELCQQEGQGQRLVRKNHWRRNMPGMCGVCIRGVVRKAVDGV